MIDNSALLNNSEETNEYLYKNYIESLKKRALIYAILGLLTGVFLGIGIIFSTIALITIKKMQVKEGTTIKWAKTLAVIGLILNGLFIASLLTYTVYVKYFLVINEALL